MRRLLFLGLSIVGCGNDMGIRPANPPLTPTCTVGYRRPDGWQSSGRVLWVSPQGIKPVQMTFDEELGAMISIEFRRGENSEGLERDALRDARQFGNGQAVVTFEKDSSRQNLRRTSRLVVEFEENPDIQSGVLHRTTYLPICGGTLGITLRYGKRQESSLKERWRVAEDVILRSLIEIPIK